MASLAAVKRTCSISPAASPPATPDYIRKRQSDDASPPSTRSHKRIKDVFEGSSSDISDVDKFDVPVVESLVPNAGSPAVTAGR